MKLLAVILILTLSALADRSVSLAWDAQPEAKSFEVSVDGKLAATVTTNEASAIPVPEGKTTVSVVAVNDGGKSLPTSLVIPAAPANPKGLVIKSVIRTTISTP